MNENYNSTDVSVIEGRKPTDRRVFYVDVGNVDVGNVDVVAAKAFIETVFFKFNNAEIKDGI